MPSWLSPTKSFWIFKLGVGWVVAFLMTVLYVRGIQLPPDIVTFNAAISACEKSNLWQEAAEAEEMMSDGEISRPVVSNIFYFHPKPWGNDPIWRINIFKSNVNVSLTVEHRKNMESICFSSNQAIASINTLQDRHLQCDVITFNADTWLNV